MTLNRHRCNGTFAVELAIHTSDVPRGGGVQSPRPEGAGGGRGGLFKTNTPPPPPVHHIYITTLRRFRILASLLILSMFSVKPPIILFGLALNTWLTFNVALEESVDYHISKYKTNPHDINYIQETVSSCL
jgi:hypothetical protein